MPSHVKRFTIFCVVVSELSLWNEDITKEPRNSPPGIFLNHSFPFLTDNTEILSLTSLCLNSSLDSKSCNISSEKIILSEGSSSWDIFMKRLIACHGRSVNICFSRQLFSSHRSISIPLHDACLLNCSNSFIVVCENKRIVTKILEFDSIGIHIVAASRIYHDTSEG